jgi:hypothetical protein
VEDEIEFGYTNVVKIGVVAGRHPLPVDKYLVQEVTPGQAAYDAVYNAAMRALPAIVEGSTKAGYSKAEIKVYYTGLTETTLAVVDASRDTGVPIQLMRWDSELGSYQRLVRGSRQIMADPPF